MADDREVLREIWDGKIPICFALFEEDLAASVEQPEPLYVSNLVSSLVVRRFVPLWYSSREWTK